MGRAALSSIVILTVLVATATSGIWNAHGAAATPVVARTFYLSTANFLSTVALSSSGTPAKTDLNGTSLEFSIQNPLLSEVTVTGQVTFSLWINSTSTTTLSPNGTLSERFLGGEFRNSTMKLSPREIFFGQQRYNFTGSIPISRTLLYGSQISIRLDTNLVSNANVTLLWGVTEYSSLVIVPLSGYLTMDLGTPVEILDGFRNPANSFDLNSTNNVVIFRARVFSAGLEDIQKVRVNLTIVDPAHKTVARGTNLNMTLFSRPSDIPPYLYVTNWVFLSNATPGTYQVNIDIIDVAGFVAFTFRDQATFVLFRGLFLPPPLDLIPYFAVGGASAVGGVFYYRRRKARSYLAPFDHFNTLTSGELDPGTVVTIEGNTGSGKTILAEQLMYEDLKRGRPCVFVATGDFPSNVRTNMKTMGLDVTGYEQSGLLTIVDGYSPEAGQESMEKFSIPSLGDLTTVGIKITSSLTRGSFKGGSLYFDSLTPLASKAKPESIVSLVQSVGARVKGMSGKAFFTVGPSVDPLIQRQLEELSDCVVQMEAFEERGVRKSRLRIAKYRARRYQQGWVLYIIEGGKGIIFYSKRPRK